MSETFTDNKAKSRFELHVDGHLAVADYRRHDEVLMIPHVEADLPLRGTGAAGRLMEQVAAAARAQGLKIRPVCSYAVAWMRRHPDNDDLLA
jgi:predicted GNAT family acetyltransferase